MVDNPPPLSDLIKRYRHLESALIYDVLDSMGLPHQQLSLGVGCRVSGHLSRWVTVNPGDFIFGDADGIVVIPQALTLEVLEDAEKVQEIEEHQRARPRAGEPRSEVYKIDRYAHVRQVVPEPGVLS
jgi:regulator of RNase E activity RraA